MTEPYVELRCQSAFSFLQGVAMPEDLVAGAAQLGYQALALTDHHSLHGAVRFLKAAAAHALHPVLGSELLIDGQPLLLLVESPVGYRHLCRLITAAQRHTGSAADGALTWTDLGALSTGLIALTGSVASPPLPARGTAHPPLDVSRIDRLAQIFDAQHLYLELQVHYDMTQDRRNIALSALAQERGLSLVLTNAVRCLRPDQALLCDALDCVRLHTTLAAAGTQLLPNAERHLKSPAHMAALLAELPQAVAETSRIAARCRFSTQDLAYRFPDYPLPPGGDQHALLRQLVFDAAPRRFSPYNDRTRQQLERELTLIARLGLSGYFLIVWDIIQLCQARGILAQGRGSAANSAVCYALSITACDPLKMGLLFERFLSEERGEWPDIDLDLPSGEDREAILAHLYRKYGPSGCAMTGSIITYRPRSAVRDLGRVFALPPAAIDRLAKSLSAYEPAEDAAAPAEPAAQTSADAVAAFSARLAESGLDPASPQMARFSALYHAMQDLPRHTAQHPGGMVVAAGRLDEVVPLQPAAMPGRLVMQWDKDDLEDVGMVKIDLLGLGMLSALAQARRLVPQHYGVPFELHDLPPDDPKTYQLAVAADTVGVFQIESRAQMAILPRLAPKTFYDLVVQVGLIRPGPILGNMVHPYLRRRMGREPVCYPHPTLEPVLSRTLGVPLFQEQIMRMAMVAAGFTGGQADELRRAMGKRRSEDKMRRLVLALRTGMAERGITGAAADQIVSSITAFAAYGFPESHAISFAYLTYASAYLKAHHPAAFFASLLNAWPMGFYHPSTLVKDAQRHGVRVLPLDVNRSDVLCTLEAPPAAAGPSPPPEPWLRIGLRFVRGLSQAAAADLVQARQVRAFDSLGDLRARVSSLSPRDLHTLAELGAFFGLDAQPTRRDALWQVSALLAHDRGGLFAGSTDPTPSPLPDMSLPERVAADYRTSSLTVGPHPVAFLRSRLHAARVFPSHALSTLKHGTLARVAGICIVRQRPPTARGTCFLTLEDEHGLANIIVPPDVVTAHHETLSKAHSALLIVEGIIQAQQGAATLRATGFVSHASVDG